MMMFTLSSVNAAYAHRDGCHRWHSCPSDNGSYVCGDLGYTSQCGGSVTTPVYTPPAPRVPVKTSKNIDREEKINFKTITKYDYREYPGYTKIKQNGVLGAKLITTTISLTDGAETSRTDSGSRVKANAVDQIIIKGGRTKPVAKIYGIANSDPGFLGMNKGKFNIWGKYTPGSKVYLFVNKVEKSSARSNSEGWFTFKNVAVDKEESWLHVFERNDDRIVTLSEKTRVNTNTKKVITEYKLLHPKSKTIQ
jgi:hypothetical protein